MNLIKKLTLSIMLVAISLSLIACGSNKREYKDISDEYIVINGNQIVITASSDIMEITQKTTLKDYTDSLSEKYAFDVELDNTGFITSINGTENKDVSYWFIYTGDSSISNEKWGKITYNETQYGSATVGIKDIIVKEGEIYIFDYHACN